jgi:hypothetical protein
MKCHLCNIELTAVPYSVWNVGGRKMVQFGCRNENCFGLYKLTKIQLDVILPEQKIIDYLFSMPLKDKWYSISSFSSSENSKTQLFSYTAEKSDIYGLRTPIEEKLISIDRFFPLVWEEPLAPQIETIFNKLKVFLVFL